MFAWLSAECRTAAENVRDPIIGGHRLVQALKSSANFDSEMKRNKGEECGYVCEFLYTARFKVVSSAAHGIMNMTGRHGIEAERLKLLLSLPTGYFFSAEFCSKTEGKAGNAKNMLADKGVW